jgi:hypothetical protein
MLAGSDGGDFSPRRASAVVDRMNQVENDVTSGKWQDLVGPCDQAFPAAVKQSGVELPRAKFDAELGCYAMSEFLVRSVSSDDPGAQQRMSELMKLRRDLDGPISSGLRARGAGGFEQARALKQAALAKMTLLGAPAETMKQCVVRFS